MRTGMRVRTRLSEHERGFACVFRWVCVCVCVCARARYRLRARSARACLRARVRSSCISCLHCMVCKVDNNVDDDPGVVVLLILGVINDDGKALLDSTSIPPQCTNAGFFGVHAKSIMAMLCLKVLFVLSYF